MRSKIIEAIVTFALVVLTVLLLNPFHFWMPDMVVTGILACILVLFAFFATFILREKAVDERDNVHRTIAGRNAYLAGAATIIIAIVIQGDDHIVDPWLVLVLIIMIVVKMISRMWSDKNL